MKIECAQRKLSESLKKVERAVGKDGGNPILSCIILETNEGALSLRATNLNLGIATTVPAKVVQKGGAAVPGAVLSSYVAGMRSDGSVSLEVKGGVLTLQSPEGTVSLKTLPSDEFPTIPAPEGDTLLTVPVSAFLRGVQAVWYGASTSSVKPELGSVFFSAEGRELICAATDSFRLAEKRIALTRTKDGAHFLIPVRNIPDILKALEGEDEALSITVSKHQVTFSLGSLSVTSRVTQGSFPDYRQIIPKEEKTSAIVLKEDLMHALKQSRLFSDQFNQVTCTVAPAKKRFEIASRNQDLGEALHTLPATFRGEDLTISFNHRYLMDCLPFIGADSVSFSFNGQAKPAVLRGVGDPTFTYLVMPMNR